MKIVREESIIMKMQDEKSEHYFKWLTRYFVSLIIFLLIILFASPYVVPNSQGVNLILLVIGFLSIISNIGYLIFLGKLASRNKKSIIIWVGTCLIFAPIAQVVTYFLMRGIVKRI